MFRFGIYPRISLGIPDGKLSLRQYLLGLWGLGVYLQETRNPGSHNQGHATTQDFEFPISVQKIVEKGGGDCGGQGSTQLVSNASALGKRLPTKKSLRKVAETVEVKARLNLFSLGPAFCCPGCERGRWQKPWKLKPDSFTTFALRSVYGGERWHKLWRLKPNSPTYSC